METEDGTDERLAELLRALLSRVEELDATPADDTGLSDPRLARYAAKRLRARRMRGKYFDSALFADPAWDMLLDLFLNNTRGVRVTTTDLCLAAEAPIATGIRWIRLLAKAELLRRYKSVEDKRLVLIELTPRGYRLMRSYLADAIGGK